MVFPVKNPPEKKKKCPGGNRYAMDHNADATQKEKSNKDRQNM